MIISKNSRNHFLQKLSLVSILEMLWNLSFTPMMKIFIPRNVSKWLFNMGITVGPITISIVQMAILAVGIGITLGVRNSLVNNGTPKATALVFSLPLFLLCVFIAFFKYSELTLIPFIAKMIRTYFLDVTKKFQVNRAKPDPKAILIATSRKTDHDIVIQQKDFQIDQKKLATLRSIAENQ